MAKKKNIAAKELISLYMEHVLTHNAPPTSVHAFAKANTFDEALFYTYFASFEALEKQIFKTFFDHTLTVLEKSEEYHTFDARNKVLSFYYTFFENLTANRSYVMYALAKHKGSLKSLSVLSALRTSFIQFIDSLAIETLDIPQAKLQKIQQKTLQESAWFQLLVTLKFWKDDTSASFEKTDIFIEKSVNTSFDLVHIKPLQSVIDLGKFLFKEKVKMSY